MRRALLLTMLVAFVFAGGEAQAYKRGMEKSNPTFSDRGDSCDRQAVNVTSGTATLVFSSTTYPSGVRELKLCNPTSFYVFIGTFSAVSGSIATATNPRETLLPNACTDTFWNTPLWAIVEIAAGAGFRVITTVIRYQSGE